MPHRLVRGLLYAYMVLLLPVAWLATKFDPYQIDGDAVNYMDLADMVRAHDWHGLVNSYWHPLYPAALALGQRLFHADRWHELGAYYAVNYGIFLLEAAAMWAFVTALVHLRRRMVTPTSILQSGEPLIAMNAMRLLGMGLLVVASQRELSMGKVRPDALLQALMLFAFAALLRTLYVESIAATLVSAALAGLAFGLAYLTKSFALAVAVLSIFLVVIAGAWLMRRTLRWAAASSVCALLPFALIAGPWISALSHKYGHLDFGDSGGLNYAWYVAGTEKMHLEPSMTAEFGSADVHLAHPEQQLLSNPGVYSYKAVPQGTYPDWLDTAWFNTGVKPHTRIGQLVTRDKRNVVLIVRYIFNHPEAPLLCLLLLLLGARWRRAGLRHAFWLPPVVIALLMWAMYTMVNVEERYVTLAWLVLVLPLFAALREPMLSASESDAWPRRIASAMIVVFAFLALGESVRVALEERRLQAAGVPTWQQPQIFTAAHALQQDGIAPGSEIACMGVTACLHDYYWARLAGTRITSEVFAPDPDHLYAQWQSLTNQTAVFAALRSQGAQALVAHFNVGDSPAPDAASGWRELGESGYWAYPLNAQLPAALPAPKPFVTHGATNQ